MRSIWRLKGRDVLGGGLGGVLAAADGVLLGGQTKRIEAHGVQHVFAFQAVVARQNICRNIPQRVPHMQPRPRGVGEHIEHIVFLCGAVFVGHKRAVVFPVLLPFGLNVLRIVLRHGGRVCFAAKLQFLKGF